MKHFLLVLLTLICERKKYSTSELPLSAFKRILIIRQHDQMGDLLLATPAIRGVRRRFPGAYLAIVVREYTAPVMLHNPHVDEVIIYREKFGRWNFQWLKKFLGSLRKNRFDCAIVLNSVSRSVTSDIIALLSKAQYIIGSDHLPSVRSGSERVYNVLIHRSEEQRHEIERNLDIVRVLGVDENELEYDLVLTEEESRRARAIAANLGLKHDRPVAGFHFGAENTARCFPLDKLAQLIDWIVEKKKMQAVLITGPAEMERQKALLRLFHTDVVVAPVMPLRIAAAFLNHVDLFFCNDTGTLHMASSQRTPTVSFHAQNDPAAWKPVHARHVGVRADDHLITSITVEQAETGVEKVMPFVNDHYRNKRISM